MMCACLLLAGSLHHPAPKPTIHRHHHRTHQVHQTTHHVQKPPAPEAHQVDTVRIGTAIQVERVTTADGRTITVLHRPGVMLP